MTTARDTIVDALDIESFVLCAHGLKAPNMTAQGSALGLNAQIISSPERAAQKSGLHFVAPLQGTLRCEFVSQGVALGCRVIAPSARVAARPAKLQTRSESGLYTVTVNGNS